VDLDQDGNLDILSGSYSRQDKDMAGLFQVLYGTKDGFKKAQPLHGSDGEPLLLPQGKGEDDVIDRICTRPFAVDMNGDGNLDLVVGNFRGTFALFLGEGKGKFAPTATWLTDGKNPIQVDSHGDPCCVDWDGDGDFDLVSGASAGGVFLFENTGSKTAPKFGKRQTLVEAAGRGHANGADGDAVTFGDKHLKAPSSETRVWVDDVDGDGKLDLLVGDRITLMHVAKGVSDADASKKLAAWRKKQADFFKQDQGEGADAQTKWREQYEALEKERETFANQDDTGFVWLYRQKK
jgi:hypothetical protein